MATISERLAYVLTFDTSSGIKSLNKLGDVADKNIGKVDKKLDRAAMSMQKWGAGAVAFAGVAGVGLYKLASGAADAEANMSALEQVVGETVAQDIGRWAENSAQGVGLASKDAVAASTSFAQLGKIIGLGGTELSTFSTDLVGLSADFAAFKNVAPEQALQDIQAAFAGSTEVMRKYGIFLDDATLKAAYFRETGEEVSGTLTAQQKIVAVNSEMYRQGADMLGQWSRESGELTGQQAILRAELTNLGDKIGAGVLPMLVSLMGTVTQLASSFASISDATGGWLGKIAGIGVALAALGGGALYVTGKMIAMRDSIKSTVARLGAGSGGISAAAAVAGVALVGLALHAKDAADDARKLTERITELGRASDDQILGQFMMALGQTIVEGDGVNNMLEELARNQLGAAVRIVEIAKAKGQETEATRMLEQAIVDEKAARDNVTKSTEAETAALEDGTDATEDGTAATEANTDAVDDAADAADAYAEQIESNVAALKDVKDAQEAARDATERSRQAQLEAIDSGLAYRNQQAETAAAVRDGTEAMNDAEEGSADYAQAARDVEAAVLDQAAAAVALKADQAEANGETFTAEQKATAYKRELETLVGYLSGPARAAIQGYIDDLGRIPSSVSTNVRVNSAGTRFTTAPTINTARYGADVAMAEGGIVKARPGGIIANIGEGGHDEAVIPLSGPNAPNGLGGSTFNVTVNAGIGTDGARVGAQVVQAIKEYERRSGDRWRR